MITTSKFPHIRNSYKLIEHLVAQKINSMFDSKNNLDESQLKAMTESFLYNKKPFIIESILLQHKNIKLRCKITITLQNVGFYKDIKHSTFDNPSHIYIKVEELDNAFIYWSKDLFYIYSDSQNMDYLVFE